MNRERVALETKAGSALKILHGMEGTAVPDLVIFPGADHRVRMAYHQIVIMPKYYNPVLYDDFEIIRSMPSISIIIVLGPVLIPIFKYMTPSS